MIDGFNKACSNISSIYLKIGDESTSAIQFHTTSKGDLPHLSYIFCKPELLGTEIMIVSCSVTGYIIFLEIRRWGYGIKSIWYHLELGTTAACTKRLIEETKGLGMRALKGSTRDYFLFAGWF